MLDLIESPLDRKKKKTKQIVVVYVLYHQFIPIVDLYII